MGRCYDLLRKSIDVENIPFSFHVFKKSTKIVVRIIRIDLIRNSMIQATAHLEKIVHVCLTFPLALVLNAVGFRPSNILIKSSFHEMMGRCGHRPLTP